MASKEKEGDKKVPLTQKEAEIRRSLVSDASGNYSVTYDLTLVIRKLADKIKDEKHDFEGDLEMTFNFHPKPDIKEPLFFLNFVDISCQMLNRYMIIVQVECVLEYMTEICQMVLLNQKQLK